MPVRVKCPVTKADLRLPWDYVGIWPDEDRVWIDCPQCRVVHSLDDRATFRASLNAGIDRRVPPHLASAVAEAAREAWNDRRIEAWLNDEGAT